MVRYALAFMTLLCFVFFVAAVFSLDFMASVYGVANLIVWGGLTWVAWPKPGFLDWLAGNRKAVEYKSARYKGSPVTLDTVLVRYQVVMSFIHFMFVNETDYEVLGSPWAQATRWACTLVTLLLGWWSLPGLQATATALDRNLKNANTTTVRQLLPEEKPRPAMAGDDPFARKLL